MEVDGMSTYKEWIRKDYTQNKKNLSHEEHKILDDRGKYGDHKR